MIYIYIYALFFYFFKIFSNLKHTHIILANAYFVPVIFFSLRIRKEINYYKGLLCGQFVVHKLLY